jgi:diguanylate cyclase (GGDEF)-like protein
MPISILLVEDNADDVDIIRRLVRRAGADFRIDQAATGGEALELARVRAYDVALVDQQLPDTRGEQLIGQMKDAVPELPIVMLTRQGDERLAVEVMKAGAFDYLRKDDLDASVLHRTVRNAVDRARLLLEVQRANDRLRDWAIRDGLTGLFNHRHFQELLRTEFARSARYGQVLACLMVDLDHFKQINDTYGHPFGDEVLKQVANTLVAEARKVDIVARYGGEEFVLVLPNTDVAGARIVAERICERIGHQPVSHDGVTVAVTLSVGVATSDDPRCSTENALVKQADAALYRAKRAGRNRVCLAIEAAGGPLSEALGLAPVTTAVREFEGEVRRLFLATLSGLLGMAERHDGFGEHGERVSRLAVAVGRVLGLESAALDALQAGALLHDVGRLAETEPLWLKPGPLSDEERSRLPRHCLNGVRALAALPSLDREREIVRHHHENWDGTGYPDGLAGERIPVLARIVAVCDAWDALTSPRPWRGPFSPMEAMRVLDAERGRRYESRMVDALSRVLREGDRQLASFHSHREP